MGHSLRQAAHALARYLKDAQGDGCACGMTVRGITKHSHVSRWLDRAW